LGIRESLLVIKRYSSFLFLFQALTLVLLGETFTGNCVGVHDGDTISVMKAGRAVKIRLEGIDCPEMGQDFGTRVKTFTSGMVFGKGVQVKEYNLDKYGRMVARVYVQGRDVSLELVKAGLAWHFKKYSSDPILAEAEEQARGLKKGLWSMPNPVPPGEYRRLHRRREDAGHVDLPFNAGRRLRRKIVPHRR
jgi:micrococcal nuclease